MQTQCTTMHSKLLQLKAANQKARSKSSRSYRKRKQTAESNKATKNAKRTAEGRKPKSDEQKTAKQSKAVEHIKQMAESKSKNRRRLRPGNKEAKAGECESGKQGTACKATNNRKYKRLQKSPSRCQNP